jgi:alpha-L-fucosidase
MSRLSIALLSFAAASALAQAQAPTGPANGGVGNRADRLEWFRDQGFGLFIHWSLDSQLGSVISHSLVGADRAYSERFFSELPRTFNPRKFNPQDWAVLARLAGIRYVVFTTKHHSGFTMFRSATTDFGIHNTPFGRDLTAEVLSAFREQGIAPGVYFSPDDFLWLYKHGKTLQRSVADVAPANNPGLLDYDRAQVRELLTNYGPIDAIFFDGPPEGLRELAWELQPNIVVTRGAIQTPEQYVPGVPIDEAWESCITMGTQWQYKPTNESYKSGGELIRLLIETRAKGGNLLLNVGPKPDGELPIEQEGRLREIALWMWVNGEAIYAVRPWVVTNEGDYWFTKKKDEDTVYVFVKGKERWKYGEWKDIQLRSVAATASTQVSVLGQSDQVLEYSTVVPKTTFAQNAQGLHIRAMPAQRLYNDRKWPNPIVLKVTHARAAMKPPVVETVSANPGTPGDRVVLSGRLRELGQSPSAEVGFEYRVITGQDRNERTAPWQPLPPARLTATGTFTATVTSWKAGEVYEYRAVARNQLLTVYGAEQVYPPRK